MDHSVERILRDSYVENSIFHTHVSMIQPRGKFQLNRQKLDDLWKSYSEKIINDENAILGIAEKPQQYLPVLVDADIKIKDVGDIEFGEHLYTPEHVSRVVNIYQSVLRNIVDDCTDENLLCVLLEKPLYYIEANNVTYAKNGFHLHFPNLFLSKVDQEVQLIPRVQELIQDGEVFADLGIENSGNIIDKACCSVPWLMYGSRKSEDMDPYKVTKVFNSEGAEIDLEEAFSNYKLYDMKERLINIKGKVKENLPRILSIIPFGRKTYELKKGLISPLKEKMQTKKKNQKTNIKISVEESLKISAELLPMLADWRAEDHNEWMTIGWILYNIGDGSSQALDQWITFSERCEDKFDEATCIYEWERMVKKDLTLGTLRYYAGIDNPEQYKEFKRKQADYFVKESLNGSHNDIAKVLYAEYGNEFVCASVANKIWYQFRDHRWEEIEEGVFLREKISEEIVLKYRDIGKEIITKLASVQDKAEEAMYNARLKQVQKIMGNLKSSPYKSSVMKEALEVFYDRRFREKLDKDPYIICFKNGVYDLKINEFRAGRPEDFISKGLPIEYKQHDMSDSIVRDVIDFFNKVFPDPEIRKYFLDTYCEIFVGSNSKKKVYMWTGDGDNGKTITQLFISMMLGELAIEFNTQYFTGKKVSSGSANPELARAAPPVRSVSMEEPDADEQLSIGELKRLSGGGRFWARDLFEKGKSTREVIPMFMLTFICNKLPKLKFSDPATWNRLRVIPFESTFVEPGKPCPETFEEQMRQKRFPMDKELASKIPDMVTAFAWYLLEWRKTVTISPDPEKVREATLIYRKQNDIYRQFIEENIIEDDSIISLTEIYATFKDWYKEGWPGTSIPIKNDVQEYFEKTWGEPSKGNKWSGYRIRSLDDDIEKGNAFILAEEDLVEYEDDDE